MSETSDPSIDTGGGAFVGGDAQAGGDFVGRDKITIQITWPAVPFTLERQPDLARLRADYLAYLRQAYQHLDFKGLPQVEKIAQQLPLDAVYVPLRARPEMPEGETWLRVAGRLWRGESLPEDGEAEGLERAHAEAGRAVPAEPVPADRALGEAPALVVLGDPGAGKSTLLKVLALALARQAEGPLPILVPLNAYAAALEQGEVSLHDFFPRYFATRQHCLHGLGPLFDAALEAGQAVVLLDGLDEVQANRGFLVRRARARAIARRRAGSRQPAGRHQPHRRLPRSAPGGPALAHLHAGRLWPGGDRALCRPLDAGLRGGGPRRHGGGPPGGAQGAG
jgi:hypothetical protein